MKIKAFFIIIIFNFSLSSQDQSTDQPQVINSSSFTQKRLGDLLSPEIGALYLTTNRFMPFVLLNYLDDWTSSGLIYSIDGIPFHNFPLNFKTPDLIPIDLLLIDTLEINHKPNLSNGFQSPHGSINIRKKSIPDSINFSLRFFTGSETGDPLIHVFTRSNLNLPNKNKVVPSGAITYSDKIDNLGFRITGGYFGYFATGSINENILFYLNNYYSKKQNKQILGSAEIEYKFSSDKKFSLSTSFISFYGWDFPPAVQNFLHFENYRTQVLAKIENVLTNISFAVNRVADAVIINPTSVSNEMKYFISDNSGMAFGNLISNKDYSLDFYSEINLSTLSQKNIALDNEISNQLLEENRIEKVSFNTSLTPKIKITDNFIGELSFGYHHHFLNGSGFSTSLNLSRFFNGGKKIELDISSITKPPTLIELFSLSSEYFDCKSIKNKTPYNTRYFFTSENNNKVSTSRITNLSLKYSDEEILNNSSYSAEVFYGFSEKPIESVNYFPSVFEQGDTIQKLLFYGNRESKRHWGMKTSLISAFLSPFVICIRYNFLNSRDFFPENSIYLSGKYTFNFCGTFFVSWYFQGKTMYRNHNNQKNEDSLPYNLDRISSLNLSFEQNLGKLFFIKELKVKILIENLLDIKNKYLPQGNYLQRLFLGSFSAKI